MGQGVVNLREEEYQLIVTELKKMHTEQLKTIKAVIKKIKTIATYGSFFSAQLTSKRVSDVLDTISNDIVKLLEQVFQESEASIEKMIENTITTDGGCS